MTEEKGLATTAQDAAMATPGAGAALQFSLRKFPEADYNRLVPTETMIVSDLLMPVVQVVKLDYEDDTYKSNDVPANHRAPNARALNKFATAAGLSFLSETRVDDGRDPDLIRVQVVVGMKLASGQWVTATGTREVDLKRMSMTPAQLAKFRSFFYEHVATRARSRAIRAILSLKSSYTDAEVRKPFAVVMLVPNTQNPEVRQAALAGMERSERAMFGPEPARAIGPGAASISLPEAPEDDVSEGQFTQVEPEPDWLAGAKPTAAAAPARHRLLALLQDNVAASALEGPASETQVAEVRDLLNAYGGDSIRAVVRHAWGSVPNEEGRLTFTAAQAEAIIAIAKTMSVPEFRGLWNELAQIASMKAGQAA